MKLLSLIFVAAVFLSCTPEAQARVHVVTLPKRDSVQLTIYNSVDLTLVRETRFLTFRKGINRLEFSWANTLIDPTSLDFRALSHADQVEVLDVSFPPRLVNTLEWRIQSEFAGEVQVEIRYFTSGINWSADYAVEASSNEKFMNLKGHVRVNNQSGEDYENAQIRLVVGVVKLVEEIASLASAGRPKNEAPASPEKLKTRMNLARSAMKALDAAVSESLALRDIVKEGVSEYFLYTVGGRDTIPHGWAKRLSSMNATNVGLASYYKYETERWGPNVIRFYKFKNDKKNNLGVEPLPDGAVMAFRVLPKDNLYTFVGRTSVKYIPIDEEVELELGPDPEVLVKPKLMAWEKSDLRFNASGNVDGWTTKEVWELEIQNSKEIAVILDYRKNLQGDWNLTSAQTQEKVDANKVKFLVPLQPLEKKTFTYEVVTRHGTNKTR